VSASCPANDTTPERDQSLNRAADVGEDHGQTQLEPPETALAWRASDATIPATGVCTRRRGCRVVESVAVPTRQVTRSEFLMRKRRSSFSRNISS